MLKKTCFISGLPRSGSTLLVNLLNQNPNFYASSSSPIIERLADFRNNWINSAFFRSINRVDIDRIVEGSMCGMFNGYAEALLDLRRQKDEALGIAAQRTVYFDKSRGWPAFPEIAMMISGAREQKDLKVICCVRDVRDACASLERRFRESSDTRLVMGQMRVEERLAELIKADGIVGNPIACMREMSARGYGRQMLIVKYERLITSPKKQMSDIYEFIGEEPFNHGFDKIDQHEKEDDFVFGFKHLHDIRPRIEEKGHTKFDDIYSGAIRKTQAWAQVELEAEFWKELKTSTTD